MAKKIGRTRIKSTLPLPIWLRRLSQVKMEHHGIRWPSVEQGFKQGIALMALGLESLEREMKARVSQDYPNSPQIRISKYLASFAQADSRWVARWRKERAKVFQR